MGVLADATTRTVFSSGSAGATVMPHVIYLHSALTQRPVSCWDRARRWRCSRRARRVDHQVLGIHHVRPGPDQLAYDLAFLASGAVLLVIGTLFARRARG